MNQSLEIGNVESLFKYLNYEYGKADKQTKHRYIVILYGPPGSGKSIAKNVASHLIKTIFKEELSVPDICHSFINTNIDSITYNVQVGNKTVSELLKENLAEHTTNPTDMSEIIKNEEQLIKSSYDIYRKHRPDVVSEMLYFFAVYSNKNIFLETSSGDSVYLNRIVNLLKYYKCIPIFVYPFVNDISILHERALCRGMTEGRFVSRNGNLGIESQMKSCLKNYTHSKEFLAELDDYVILMYNADIDLALVNEFKNCEFSGLDKLTIEKIYQTKVNKYFQKHEQKIDEFNVITTLKLN
jgi:hypothetical protein